MVLGVAGELVGLSAGLGTALCWSFTSIWFSAAGRRIGSLPTNLLRMPFALAWLIAHGLVFRGLPLPTDATPHAWLWLSTSALLGFAFGDLCLFRALVLIGPRLGSLVMASAPVFTTIFGAWWLGESLEPRDAVGTALVCAGIAWAVSARHHGGNADEIPRPVLLRGVGLAALGAIGQASGLVTAKLGMGEYDAFAATQARVWVGMIAFAIATTVSGGWGQAARAVRDRRAMMMVALGGTFGPFLGVGLSLTAAQNVAAGVAASLMALQPILVIPLSVWFTRERVGLAALGGAAVAVGGVVLLVT